MNNKKTKKHERTNQFLIDLRYRYKVVKNNSKYPYEVNPYVKPKPKDWDGTYVILCKSGVIDVHHFEKEGQAVLMYSHFGSGRKLTHIIRHGSPFITDFLKGDDEGFVYFRAENIGKLEKIIGIKKRKQYSQVVIDKLRANALNNLVKKQDICIIPLPSKPIQAFKPTDKDSRKVFLESTVTS